MLTISWNSKTSSDERKWSHPLRNYLWLTADDLSSREYRSQLASGGIGHSGWLWAFSMRPLRRLAVRKRGWFFHFGSSICGSFSKRLGSLSLLKSACPLARSFLLLKSRNWGSDRCVDGFCVAFVAGALCALLCALGHFPG